MARYNINKNKSITSASSSTNIHIFIKSIICEKECFFGICIFMKLEATSFLSSSECYNTSKLKCIISKKCYSYCFVVKVIVMTSW